MIRFFSPIHRILFFASENKFEDLERIQKVIYENYSLASDAVIEEFGKCFDNDEITNEFEHIIQSGYILLRNKLGYSKLKLNKTVKQNISKTIIITTRKSSLKEKILECIFYTLMPIVIIVLVFLATTFASKLS